LGSDDGGIARRPAEPFALRGRLGLPPGDSAIVTAQGGLERLRAAGIKASVRAGAVRLSFHLHNTEADVDAVARALGC